MKRKGQVSLEFILIFAFALIIFVLLLALLVQFLDSGRDNRIIQEYEYVAHSISKNLLIAAKGPGEVSLSLSLPEKIAGQSYAVKKDGNVLIILSNDEIYSIRFAIPNIEDSSVFSAGMEHIIRREVDGTITATTI